MSDINDLQITVTKIIKSTGRGILIFGHVDSGIVQVRDILQAHNHQPGVTARAGRLYKSGKKIEEAQAGNDIKLLLERIEETEIHPDDRLRLGDKKDLRKIQKKVPRLADAESWEKLPERIEPILHLRQFITRMAYLVFLSIILIVALLIIVPSLIEMMATGISLENLLVVGCLLILSGFLGFFIYGAITDFINGIHGRIRFLQGQSQVIAQILRCKAIENRSDYGPAYTYYVQLEFIPSAATTGVDSVRLKAQVSKKLYEKLAGSKTVHVAYAVEDPRIFIIEGE